MLRIVIEKDGVAQDACMVAGPEVRVGRGKDNDVVLADPNISKNHFRIIQAHDSIMVIDNGSTNGTCINGERIDVPYSIKDGDRIHVGSYVLAVERAEQQEPDQSGTRPNVHPNKSAEMPLERTRPAAAAPSRQVPSTEDVPLDDVGGFEPLRQQTLDTAPGNRAPAAASAKAAEAFDDWEPVAGAKASAVAAASAAGDLASDFGVPEKPRKSAAPQAGADANALRQCLERYVQIDEYYQREARGESCRCGKCLLCQAKRALGL
jgi:predicted component of type VI protein secretion system